MNEPPEASRPAPAPDAAAGGGPPRLRLTDRDRTIAQFVARWGPATQPQIARRAEMSRVPSFRRLQALRDAGYLHYERPVEELPGVFTVTARGVELAGGVREVAGPPPAYALWPHLAAVDEAITAELEGLRTATRLEALADEKIRASLPHTPRGAPVPPRLVVFDAQGLLCVYAVLRPASGGGVGDELLAVALESYLQLAPHGRRRVLVSNEVADMPAVEALRASGAELVALDPDMVGRGRG